MIKRLNGTNDGLSMSEMAFSFVGLKKPLLVH